jgi:hypothetical protein
VKIFFSGATGVIGRRTIASEGGRAQKSRGPSRYGLTATNPSTALRQRAVSQLQHSLKFGTQGFASPDPHTIAYETGWPARSRSWGKGSDRDRAFFGEESPPV